MPGQELLTHEMPNNLEAETSPSSPQDPEAQAAWLTITHTYTPAHTQGALLDMVGYL